MLQRLHFDTCNRPVAGYTHYVEKDGWIRQDAPLDRVEALKVLMVGLNPLTGSQLAAMSALVRRARRLNPHVTITYGENARPYAKRMPEPEAVHCPCPDCQRRLASAS